MSMKSAKCYLCNGTELKPVSGRVRDIPDMSILRCSDCGLVFLESFDHIDESFYENSKMRKDDEITDIKGQLKECEPDDSRRASWMKPLIINKAVLDVGCGAGGFLLKARDVAAKCAGVEREDSYRNILKTNFGLDIYQDIYNVSRSYDVITLFHVLEHLKDPKGVLQQLVQLLGPDGSIIIEVPNADDALLSLYQSKPFSEFTYWGPHLYYFNNTTLRKLVHDSGLKVNFIQQIQRYPLSNHLYWLSKGKPGGHRIWSFLDTPELHSVYESQLARVGLCDTIIASVSRQTE